MTNFEGRRNAAGCAGAEDGQVGEGAEVVGSLWLFGYNSSNACRQFHNDATLCVLLWHVSYQNVYHCIILISAGFTLWIRKRVSGTISSIRSKRRVEDCLCPGVRLF
jgi:hypothetical protein